MPPGNRAALLVGHGIHASRFVAQEWETLLSNADMWTIGARVQQLEKSSPLYEASHNIKPRRYHYSVCPLDQQGEGNGLVHACATSPVRYTHNFHDCRNMSTTEKAYKQSCQEDVNTCFQRQVQACSLHSAPGYYEECWEHWGRQYADDAIKCNNGPLKMSILEYIALMKRLRYKAVFVIGDVSDGIQGKQALGGLSNAVAITASIRGMRLINLNDRGIIDGNWLRETVYTMVEDRDIRCGANNFEHPLNLPDIHAPRALDDDPTVNMPFTPDTTPQWALWNQVPNPSTINLPRTQKRTALVVGPGPSLLNMTEDQWNVIKAHTEVWGLNEIFPHDFLTPHFLHLEVESGDHEFFNTDSLCTRDRFKNGTVLVMEQGRNEIKRIPCLLAMPKRGYDRTGWGEESTPPPPMNCICTAKTGRSRPHGNQVDIPCCVTLNRIMALFTRLGYEHVYFLGIDGKGGYFYNEEPYHIRWNRDELEHRASTHAQHPTMGTGIAQWLWAFGQYNGLQLTNLATDGNLKDTLYTQSVSDFVDELVQGCQQPVGPVTNFSSHFSPTVHETSGRSVTTLALMSDSQNVPSESEWLQDGQPHETHFPPAQPPSITPQSPIARGSGVLLPSSHSPSVVTARPPAPVANVHIRSPAPITSPVPPASVLSPALVNQALPPAPVHT